MKKISLNSLVFLIDVVSGQVSDQFQPHEILSYETITRQLLGVSNRNDMREVVRAELERQIFLRLSLGQRVVVDAPEMRREARVSLVLSANSMGYNVYYLVDADGFNRNAVRNDRGVEIVELNQPNVEIVQQMPDGEFFQSVEQAGYDGLTVVGDVHGMLNNLRDAVSWAKKRNHFMLFLGDVVDYGPDSLEVADEVYHLVIRGEAEALLGNHERKISRYITPTNKNAAHMRLSAGNRVTTGKLESMNTFDRDRWVNRFTSLVRLMRNHRTCGQYIFAHGAVSPEMWQTNEFRLKSSLEELTLFGEVDDHAKAPDKYPNRVYSWVDALTTGQTAVVGHDIRGDLIPFTHKSANGGKAIFLDTGCGKGGRLSTLDIRFRGSDAYIENINIH